MCFFLFSRKLWLENLCRKKIRKLKIQMKYMKINLKIQIKIMKLILHTMENDIKKNTFRNKEQEKEEEKEWDKEEDKEDKEEEEGTGGGDEGRGEEGKGEEQQIGYILEVNNITNYDLTDIEELFQYLTNEDSGCSNSSVYTVQRH